MARISEQYGSLVFNEHVMQERLPKATYKSLRKTIDEGQALDPDVANVVAHAMKEEPVPPFLRAMTLDILKRHGTHPDTDLDRLSREGFLPAPLKLDVPRWNLENLHRVGPWNWCSKRIPRPEFEDMYIQD